MRFDLSSSARWLLAALLALAPVAPASAYQGGISSTVFGSTGCPACHTGGVPPSVLLSGPAAVQPGSTVTFTLTVFGNAAQDNAGFNVAASLGTLSTGGPFAAGTRTITGMTGMTEITHSAPKPGDFLSVAEFSFLWTLPSDFAGATLRAWGNAVDLSGSPFGDAAALATLNVGAMPTSTPVPTATPTPTAITCGTGAALLPPLPPDSAAGCQAGLAKAGIKYVKKDLKAVGECLGALHAGALSGDGAELCVGTATGLPTHPKTATRIGRAQTKALALLESACSDSALGELDACAATLDGLAACFLAQHRQAVIDAVASQYGTVVPSDDRARRKCQKAIGGAAVRFLTSTLKGAQKCLTKRFDESAANGGSLCVGTVTDGSYVPPSDEQAATAMAAAAAKLAAQVAKKCDDAQIAALDVCGETLAEAGACLLCSHATPCNIF
jgi:hypothetical protein